MRNLNSLFAFEDPVDFLQYHLRERQRIDSGYSLRQWSRALGYENPSYLSHVLKRQRKLKPDLALKIADDLGMKGRVRRYFELSVLKKNSRSEMERATYQRMMRELRPGSNLTMSRISLEMVAMISDWYHVALHEIAALPDFDGTASYLLRRLGPKVPKRLGQQAIERLVQIGLFSRDASGKLHRSKPGARVYEGELPSAAVRSAHQQFGSLALRALEEQTIDEREFRAITVGIPADRIPDARKILAECARQIASLSLHPGAQDVYQANLQFFRLSEPSQRRLH